MEAKPDDVDARLQFGARLLSKQDYQGALDALSGAREVNEQQAEWFFGVMAFAQIQTGQREAARNNALLTKKWAKTPDETRQAHDLIRYLDENGGRAGQAKLQLIEPA